eukprot:1077322-Alexandrium_andersonii.AAC.2
MLEAVCEEVRKVAKAPAYFQKMELTSTALWNLDFHNGARAEGKRRDAPHAWDHLKDGFYGTQRRELQDSQTVEQEDLVRGWGYATYCMFASAYTERAAAKARMG